MVGGLWCYIPASAPCYRVTLSWGCLVLICKMGLLNTLVPRTFRRISSICTRTAPKPPRIYPYHRNEVFCTLLVRSKHTAHQNKVPLFLYIGTCNYLLWYFTLPSLFAATIGHCQIWAWEDKELLYHCSCRSWQKHFGRQVTGDDW